MPTARVLISLLSVGILSSTPLLRAQPSSGASITGEWTLSTELSDAPPADQPEDGDGPRRGGGRGGPGSGGFGGGRGGGGRGGPGGGRGGPGRGEDMQRRRDALRAILVAPERMTITRTESMVIITTQDGRTTRLATDGAKVKDESTGVEQRTRWVGDALVTEISGLQGGKITQTYEVDPAARRLTVTIVAAGARGQSPAPRRHVYEAAAR